MVQRETLRALLERVQRGDLEPEQALEELSVLPFRRIEGATVDTHRALRQGMPEIIYGEGKAPETLAAIATALNESGQPALATRVSETLAADVLARAPGGEYHAGSRTLWWGAGQTATRRRGKLVIVSAGSTDAPVLEEARVVAEHLGNKVEVVCDVGVAGLHRLLDRLPVLRSARVVIAIAGMEGALPSVVGGLVACPVVAVPTSTGYGAALEGVTALLAMLSSCASNVSVVNIDNGVSAAVVASLINRD